MKELVAATALLCLSSSVLAHDIYSNLRDKAGHYCCNGQDCRPVQATVLPMAVTICRRLTKLFPPTWQHHHLMIASTIVPIIRWQMILTPRDQYGLTHL